ncbi:hypothetical protein SeMB42_g04667 [Synchytrium endobioticum]|uniref:Uncharacterized protein n=1 Tax=Synchytrium endobioticum TaxID=286115 RepID=A0A507CWQ2_9FUNG|nr:hypothetical protein SeMB42_g04667 [Synchytrium endobioticum]
MSQEGLIDHCIDPDTGPVTKPTKEKDESPSALQKRINVFNAESAKAAKYVRDRVSSEVKDVLDIKWTAKQMLAYLDETYSSVENIKFEDVFESYLSLETDSSDLTHGSRRLKPGWN